MLFPFVLDGRIDPKRLNPFASEDRTMKSNLLYRGQDSAYGYVWLEFASPLTGEAVTVGAGLHAQKHRDQPKRWYFVTDARVGADFSLGYSGSTSRRTEAARVSAVKISASHGRPVFATRG
ncbi:hypothetical protein GCM10029978_112620 [Actinoallomurus acanthiterrae]